MMMKRVLYILLFAMVLGVVAPIVSVVDNSVAAVYAVDDKAKAKANAEKAKAKAAAQKQKEKEKAAAAKAKAKANAEKAKAKAKADADKAKAKAKADADKAKAKANAEKAKAKAAADKAKAKANAGKAKAEPELTPQEEKEQYMAQIAAIEKKNQRVLAYLNRDISHRLGFWGQVGYSNLFTSGITYSAPTAPGLNPVGFMNNDKGFVGGGLGVGYQLRYQQFLLTTGLEFNTYNSDMGFSNQPDGTFLLSYGMNPYPNTMTYHYDFSGLNDRLVTGFAQIPILAGMELKSFPLFWQAGVKVGMGVWGQSTITGRLSTTIDDKELIEGMTDMWNHTLVTNADVAAVNPNCRPTAVQLGLNVAATAEVGVNLDPWLQGPKVRVSAFADYGFLNVRDRKMTIVNNPNAQDIPMQMMVDNNPLHFPVISALSTTSATNAKVNPFLVGVKVAVWFELPRKQLVIGDMPAKPLPRLGVRAFDEETGVALGGVAIEVLDSADVTKKKNSNKQGLIKVGRVAEGQYRVVANKNGYFATDTITYTVEEFTYDTIQVPLRRIPAPIIPTLCMNIYDEETNEPIEALARLTSLNDTIVLYEAQSADDGFVETPLTEGSYIAHLTAQGYMPEDDTIHFVSDTVDLFMQPIKKGIKVKIENLFFATNKTYILPQSEQAMSDLATFLLENPTVTIHITGHTDAVGTDEANQILSEGRANAVRQNLIDRGVAPERMTAEGKGEKEPVADNDTEEGRQLNRRVEFIITGTDGADIEQVFE